MKKARFKGFAATLPVMLVGDRIRGDLETLADLPDGELTLDLVSGRAQHSSPAGERQVSLRVVSELAEWLRGQMLAHDIAPGFLERATLSLKLRTDRIPTDRKRIVSFDLECDARLEAGGLDYRGRASNHIWHDRCPG